MQQLIVSVGQFSSHHFGLVFFVPLLPTPPPTGAPPLPPPSGAPSSPPPTSAPSSPSPTGAPPDPPSSLERRHPAAPAVFPSAPLPPSSPERHRPATPAHGTSGPIAGLPPPRSAGGAPNPASRPVPATRPPPQPLQQPSTSTRCPGGSDPHLAPPSNPASLRPGLLPARGRLASSWRTAAPTIWIDVPLELDVNDMLKRKGAQAISDPDSFSQAMAKLRQRYDDLKERYAVSDVTVSVQNVASQLGYSSIDSLSLEDMVIEVCNISIL
ncbi:hypothetical protein VPH35_068157 [Triticum aestivum]